ncbi:hypothetical protein HMN09_00738000 [Mycena chlorophos]|uniref:RING-CH-type domain-containing protein n=1 Tax=Mycena chlorophos TaxID=658473 RepID=A0A8H6STH2_MYCCL|nr:hypothetical protein HMN09_00738000 [Mycena chlorophos]
MSGVPTLDDIRVKKCFICLEEEEISQPGSTSSSKDPWIHPCPYCALLAHEMCLFRWTASLPVTNTPLAAAGSSTQTLFILDSFRCPRCRRRYELAEPLSPRLHTLIIVANTLYRTTSGLVDTAFTGAGLLLLEAIPLGVAFQSRLIVLSGMIAYELAFMRSYLGSRLFRLFVPARPADLFRSLSITIPTLPFRLLLPGTVPEWTVPLYASLPQLIYALTQLGALTLAPPRFLSPAPTARVSSSVSTPTKLKLYPPTPLLLGLIVPTLLRPLYRSLKHRIASAILGAPPPEYQRRYLTERIRGVFTIPMGRRRRRNPFNGNRNGNANANGNQQQPEIVLQDGTADDDTRDPLVMATRIIQKDQKSLTHDVLHALASLVIPRAIRAVLKIAAMSGDGPLNTLLRRFMCFRTTLSPAAIPARTTVTSLLDKLDKQTVFRTVFGLFLGGAGVWADSESDEPIWWQTSVGWGLYVVAKDALELYRLYLQTAEVRSRKVKDRDFAGVDVRELELIAR